MDRIALFPITTKIEKDSLTIAGHDLASLVDLYGTPLYLYDHATLTKKTPGRRCLIKASGKAIMECRRSTLGEMNLQHSSLISMIVKTGKVTI